MEIDIRNCPKLTDLSLFAIAENCPNLIHIYLDNIKYTKEGLRKLQEMCPKQSEISKIALNQRKRKY